MKRDPITSIIVRVLELLVGKYIEAFSDILRTSARILGVPPPRIFLGDTEKPIDERLKKLDVAKAALSESLSAIEELRTDAEARKQEHAQILAELEATVLSKQDAEQKLESIRALMDQDIEAFQTLAGVQHGRRQALIGFASGVAASILAALIYAGAAYLIRSFSS